MFSSGDVTTENAVVELICIPAVTDMFPFVLWSRTLGCERFLVDRRR